jgi:cytochrome c-type biogenesis protein CcmE
MKPKHRRLTFLALGLGLLAIAAVLILSALDDSLVFFMSPTDALASPPPPDRAIRIGGLVEEGSLERATGDTTVRFRVTDLETAIPVTFEGVLPDLFREGQGVVVEGTLGADGAFTASEVLAKHDENYMPPEVAEAIKQSGHWQGEEGAATE